MELLRCTKCDIVITYDYDWIDDDACKDCNKVFCINCIINHGRKCCQCSEMRCKEINCLTCGQYGCNKCLFTCSDCCQSFCKWCSSKLCHSSCRICHLKQCRDCWDERDFKILGYKLQADIKYLLFVLKNLKVFVPYFIRIHICRQFISLFKHPVFYQPYKFVDFKDELWEMAVRLSRTNPYLCKSLDFLICCIKNVNKNNKTNNITEIAFDLELGSIDICRSNMEPIKYPGLCPYPVIPLDLSWSELQYYFYHIDLMIKTLLKQHPTIFEHVQELYSRSNDKFDLSLEITL